MHSSDGDSPPHTSRTQRGGRRVYTRPSLVSRICPRTFCPTPSEKQPLFIPVTSYWRQRRCCSLTHKQKCNPRKNTQVTQPSTMPHHASTLHGRVPSGEPRHHARSRPEQLSHREVDIAPEHWWLQRFLPGAAAVPRDSWRCLETTLTVESYL